MSSILVEIAAGIKRRIFRLQGSVKPLSSQDTTVPKWISTPQYDPLNGEAIVGVDGSDRIQLAADGKIYPPLLAGGLSRNGSWIPDGQPVTVQSNALTEVPIIAVAGYYQLLCVQSLTDSCLPLLYITTGGTNKLWSSYTNTAYIALDIPTAVFYVPTLFVIMSVAAKNCTVTYQKVKWASGP